MRKIVLLFLIAAAFLSLPATAWADSSHFSVEADTVTIRDDGAGQAYDDFVFYTPIDAVIAKNDAFSVTVKWIRLGNMLAFSETNAAWYEAAVGDFFGLITIEISIENTGKSDIILDPAESIVVTSAKEQARCLAPQTSAFDQLLLTGAEQEGKLTFKSVKATADELDSFRLHIPAATDLSGETVASPTDIYFTLDKEYQEPVDPALTSTQQLAAWKARNFLRGVKYTSRQELIDLLIRWDYSEADAAAAVDWLHADFNELALDDARNFLRKISSSKDDLVFHLESVGYTQEEIDNALHILNQK